VCELKLPEDLGDDGDPPLPDADHPLPEGDSGEGLGDDGALWAKGKLELHILIIITFIVSYHVFLRTFLYEKNIYYIYASLRDSCKLFVFSHGSNKIATKIKLCTRS